MLGSVTRQKVCQPLSAQRQRRLLVGRALLLHQRDQFARHEGEGDEDRGQHDAGHGEHDLDAVALQPGTEQALRAEQQHIDQAGDDRRDRERQVDQRGQEGLAPNSNLAIAQAAATPKTRLSGTAMAATSSVSRMAASVSRLVQGEQELASTLAERLDEDRSKRQHEEQRQEDQRDGDQRTLGERAFRRRRRSAIAGRSRDRRPCRRSVMRHSHTSCGSRPGSRLMTNSMAKEIISMIAAIAVAPA